MKALWALICLFAAVSSFADEVVASASGGWFAVDARAVKDTTWGGGAIVGGETNFLLQSSPNAWNEDGGGADATLTWTSTSGNNGTIAAATTAETILWTPEARVGTNTLTYVSGSVVKTAQFVVVGLGLNEPTVSDDPGAVVTGDAENGFVIQPSAGKKTVVVTIPDGVAAEKVTVVVGTDVTSVASHGAKVRIVKDSHDITSYLNMPSADGSGVIDLTQAAVKESVVKEAMDTSKGAIIELNAEAPSLTTSETKPGLTYTLKEGTSIKGMTSGDRKVGDGNAWTPTVTVKGGASGFYSIDVSK